MHFNLKNILIKYGFDSENGNKTVYLDLHESLKKAISNRALREKEKLPPSRVLAKDLQISRSTVIKAYDLLILEKYIKSIPGSGCFVTAGKTVKIHYSLNTHIQPGKYPRISKRGQSFKKNVQLVSKSTDKGIAFRPGLPPLDIFPITQWKHLFDEYWKTVRSSELSYSKTIGIESLRLNISDYLKNYRNINCDPNQIIITTGSLHSLSLIADALINRKDEVVLENPTYPHAFHLFNSLKAKICTANVDNEGIAINEAVCTKPKLVYTTPSNQYPTGIKMTIKRRLELLKWASAHNAIIVEDDYDNEVSNWENPISPIFSLDKQERVVYLGTFNKLLHPSLRLGYMIVPYYLLDTVIALYQQSSRFVSPSLQKTLSAFIEKGYLNKHLRRVIAVSVERKKIFVDWFNASFYDEVSIDASNSGLHLIGKLKSGIEDTLIADFLQRRGITVHPYSNYFIGKERKNGLVMGYCSVNDKLIKETILKMKDEYTNLLNL